MAREQELIRLLQRLGRARGAELTRLLEISPATLSRAVRAAGDDICRMGRRRGATYALRRRIGSLPAAIPVFRIDRSGQPARLGDLHPLRDGAHWLELGDGRGVLYEGTPPFIADMQPQGYLGAGFSARHPELDLPARLSDWNDDHRLIALAHRGEDCIGNLLLGEVSFDRFWRLREAGVEPIADAAYPDRADHALERQAGSSAGGEHPKFTAFGAAADAHVLVKFTTGAGDAGDRRWHDLLVCEALALDTLRGEDIEVPATRLLEVDGRCFLESVRFDRSGHFGRIGVVSMAAFDAEYTGVGRDWPRVAAAMQRAGHLGADDVRHIRFLDVFGRLIGNTDRHLGNLSFLAPDPGDTSGRLRPAPVYDMLPMAFAPASGRIVRTTFDPGHPGADDLEVWPRAVRAASAFWQRVCDDGRIGADFRSLAEHALAAVSRMTAR